jgi:hypothetical protein
LVGLGYAARCEGEQLLGAGWEASCGRPGAVSIAAKAGSPTPTVKELLLFHTCEMQWNQNDERNETEGIHGHQGNAPSNTSANHHSPALPSWWSSAGCRAGKRGGTAGGKGGKTWHAALRKSGRRQQHAPQNLSAGRVKPAQHNPLHVPCGCAAPSASIGGRHEPNTRV